MNQTCHQKNLNPDNNISKTGYRALFILLKLLESPKSRTELLEYISCDPVIKNDLSKDSITNTINALKKAGCIISRPSQRTNNKYILKYHPFSLSLSKENVIALQTIRESLVTFGDWRLLINLNNLYAKIAKYVQDSTYQKILLYNHPLRDINHQIIKRLMFHAGIKKHTIVTYDSPERGKEDLYFTPEYITMENRKLYVWGYCKKYNEFSYLRVDRIKNVNFINFLAENDEDDEFQKSNIIVEYKLKGLSAVMFQTEIYETVLEKTPDEEYKMTVKAVVNNKFNFIQRILSFGSDCLLLSGDEIKNELEQKLKAMKEIYSHDPEQ